MEILFGILSWDFGNSFGPAFGSWWGATGWLATVMFGLAVAAYLGIQAYSYVMDQKSPFPFFSEYSICFIPVALGVTIGTFVLSLILLAGLMFWEVSVIVLGTYALLRTARGVVRLRKALNKHIDDKNAHAK